jgi:hypothetical protein
MGTVTDENPGTGVAEPTAQEPVIKVLRGQPTDDDLAALVCVLAGASGGGQADHGPVSRDLWGHPVDRLRYSIVSWQRVTQVERTHVRR